MTTDSVSGKRLRVTIVGAGLCGLAAGAAMREYADVNVRNRPKPSHHSLLDTERKR